MYSMIVPTGMVLFFTVAGNWKKKKEVTMSENKAYWERHGTKNKRYDSRQIIFQRDRMGDCLPKQKTMQGTITFFSDCMNLNNSF